MSCYYATTHRYDGSHSEPATHTCDPTAMHTDGQTYLRTYHLIDEDRAIVCAALENYENYRGT